MASLEDELMADFGDDIDAVEEHQQYKEEEDKEDKEDKEKGRLDDRINQAKTDIEGKGEDLTTESVLDNLDLSGAELSSVSTLMAQLDPIVERIRADPMPTSLVGMNIDNHPSYKLLVDANNYAVQIDNEMLIVHKLLSTTYAKRLPELSAMVQHPIDYAKVVQVVGNDDGLDEEKLKQVLPSATYFAIRMSSYKNPGSRLTDHELGQCINASELLIKFDRIKTEITEFVSSRLAFFAPNVTHLIPSRTAAEILGFVGGIKQLSVKPNSNIPTIGSKRQVGIGLGITGMKRQGFLYHIDLVQKMPEDKRLKAMKVIAGKLVLAARVDAQHSCPDGSLGLAWYREVNDKLDKMVEAPEVTKTKALPVPTEQKTKRRGGKKFRRWKEIHGETEMQKAQNRLGFGGATGTYEEDEIDQAQMVKPGGGGPVRVSKNRAKLNKRNRAQLDRINQSQQSIELPSSSTVEASASATASASASALPAALAAGPSRQDQGTSNWFTRTHFAAASNKRKLENDSAELPAKRQK